MTTICSIEPPKPDYSFIYAKLARHVAVADALLASNRAFEAASELESAMQAIAAFETMLFIIKTDDN